VPGTRCRGLALASRPGRRRQLVSRPAAGARALQWIRRRAGTPGRTAGKALGDRLARLLRRPLPARPNPFARRGTAFHAWLEQRYGSPQLLDVDELPGAADDAPPDEDLAALQERFLASEWADRTPVAVEVPFVTVAGGVVVRGRMDAVFPSGDDRYEVVDWKTGALPVGADATAATVQLAAYRLAWAALAGVPPAQVSAAFHYVRDGVTVRPADLLDEAGLTALVTTLPVAD